MKTAYKALVSVFIIFIGLSTSVSAQTPDHTQMSTEAADSFDKESEDVNETTLTEHDIEDVGETTLTEDDNENAGDTVQTELVSEDLSMETAVKSILIAKTSLKTNEQQLVAVLFNQLPAEIEYVDLVLETEDGRNTMKIRCSIIDSDMVVFDFSVAKPGTYYLKAVDIQTQNDSYDVYLEEGSLFSVVDDMDSYIVQNEGGNISDDGISAAIDNAYGSLWRSGFRERFYAAPGHELKIVLNAGHDDTHRRDHPDLGVNEQDLNLAIAQACKEELEKYANVIVYMVREDGSCCRGSVFTSESQCLKSRTDYVASVGATLHVSLHNNGLTGSWHNTSGSIVYVSGHSDYFGESERISDEVLSRLSALGFPDIYGEPVVREFGNDYTYANGDALDYYHDIRECILAGIPGILIEHGFQDNMHDNALLKDPEVVRQLGIADAQALVTYYGLQLKSEADAPEIKQERLNLSESSLAIEVGSSTQLNAMVYPMQSAKIEWEVSDPSIVSIKESNKGINSTLTIVGLKPGSVTITGRTGQLVESCKVEVYSGPRKLCTDFIERLYTIILDRKSDPKGLNEWVDVLYSGTTNAAEVSDGFVFSREFIEKNYSNDAYIQHLYRAFFDREPDEKGFEDWLYLLDHGVSRKKVLKGFVESVEFDKLCATFGIQRGTLILTDPRDQNNNVTMFIYRCYEDILGRKPDDEGLNGWTKQINDKIESPKDIIHGFILSKEFLKRNYTDEEYIEILYRTFLNRKYDSQGLKEWCDVLNGGSSRVDILDGFYYSPEYQQLLRSYGL